MPAFMPEHLLPLLTSFRDARRCWIAYSGGADSEVLLTAAASLQDRLEAEVCAVHLDHRLHADSSAWAMCCRERCEQLGVPVRVLQADAAPARGESPEAAAREVRYRSLGRLLEPGDLLLTAHHRDDQAETLLLALMRGSGLKGLAAMPQVTDLGVGRLVRPLLEVGRADLREYAEWIGLEWVEDPGNLDQAFDRNFLRHRVLPLLAQRWPACNVTIARSAHHCAEAQVLIDELAERRLVDLAGTRSGTLSIAGLRAMDENVARAALRLWFRKLGLPPPDMRRMVRILGEVLSARVDADPLVNWPDCEVRRYRDDLFAMAPLPPRPPDGSIRWEAGALELSPGVGRLFLLDGSARRVDPERVFPPGLVVRFGVEGLSCRPAPQAHRRSLKKLFQEVGVPPWLRSYVPLIFAADELAAIGDRWVCTNAGDGKVFHIRWEDGIRTHAGFQTPSFGKPDRQTLALDGRTPGGEREKD